MQKEKKAIPYNKIVILLTALSVIGTIVIYPHLPAAIPYHFGIGGTVKTAGKWIAFVTALLPLILYYVSILFPKKNQANPEAVAFIVAMLLVVMHWIILFITIR